MEGRWAALEVSPPSSLYRRGVYLFVGVVMALLFSAHVVPFESWPLTHAPMYAFYAGGDTPRYRFRFTPYSDSGKKLKELRRFGAVRNQRMKRIFFARVYGSEMDIHPYGTFEDDTRKRFEDRLSIFFRGLAKYARRRKWHRSLATINLEVIRLNKFNRGGKSHLVGTFDRRTGRFTHTWRPK